MQKRILIIRLGSLGDVILTSPTVLNLRLAFPEAQIDFLTKERFAEIVRRFDGVDTVVTIPNKPSLGEYLKILYRLDEDNYTTVVDLHRNSRSWLARKMLHAPETVMYNKRRVEREQIVRRKKIPESWPHTIDMYNKAVLELGAEPVVRRPIIKYDRTKSNKEYIVIAPGAAHETKRWPAERFSEVAHKVHQETGLKTKWVVASSDYPKGIDLASVVTDFIEPVVDRNLTEIIELLSNAKLVISNDTGLAHLSSAVGTELIVLFGPTHPSLGFAPRGLRDEVIGVNESCSPCSLHGSKVCIREERFCFTRISTDAVATRALAKLSETSGERALFLDRDGTLIVEKNYLSHPDAVELIPGVAEALRKAKKAGYKLIIVSNQSGVARGFFQIEEVERVMGRTLELFSAEHVEFDGVYFCPHHPDGNVRDFSIKCECRKPNPAMIEQAVIELGIDLRRSVVIGDSLVDYNLARGVGARGMIVRTGYGKTTEQKLASQIPENVNVVFDSLGDAVESLMEQRPLLDWEDPINYSMFINLIQPFTINLGTPKNNTPLSDLSNRSSKENRSKDD